MKYLLLFGLICPALSWGESQAQSNAEQGTINGTAKKLEQSQADSRNATKKALLQEPQVPESATKRAKQSNGLIQQRVDREKETANNPFVLTPYKPNYLLPFNYNPHPVSRQFLGVPNDTHDVDDVEIKFQLSVKFPLLYDVVGKDSSLWVAYTHRYLFGKPMIAEPLRHFVIQTMSLKPF